MVNILVLKEWKMKAVCGDGCGSQLELAEFDLQLDPSFSSTWNNEFSRAKGENLFMVVCPVCGERVKQAYFNKYKLPPLILKAALERLSQSDK